MMPSTLPPTALAACLFASVAAAQTTWYVDVQAPAPGDGSLASPYANLSFALAQPTTVSGDTLVVAPGTYPSPIAILKGVTVRASGGPEVTRIRWVPPQSVAVGVSHAQASLEGFTIQGAEWPGGVGVQLANGAAARRCVMTGFTVASYGIEVDIDGVVDHCTVTGNWNGITSLGIQVSALGLSNSIVGGNANKDLFGAGTTLLATVDYCVGLDGDPVWLSNGTGNLPVDPQTLFPTFGDAHLAAGSPCIDAASPASPLDPDGSPADIGALPFEVAYAPGPKVYCTGKLHSQGCVADIGFQGQPSLSSAQPFLITATEAPAQQIGLLFYGFGPRAAPLWGGVHCIQPPTPRTTGQFSGGAAACSGSFAFDFNAWMQVHGDIEFVPGTAIFAQYWFRDAADPLGFGVGFTDALSFLIAP